MLGGLLVEFLGYWMAEGWLVGGLAGGCWCWLGCWLGVGWPQGPPEPREAGPVRVMRLFGEHRKHQFHIETVTITTE